MFAHLQSIRYLFSIISMIDIIKSCLYSNLVSIYAYVYLSINLNINFVLWSIPHQMRDYETSLTFCCCELPHFKYLVNLRSKGIWLTVYPGSITSHLMSGKVVILCNILSFLNVLLEGTGDIVVVSSASHASGPRSKSQLGTSFLPLYFWP